MKRSMPRLASTTPVVTPRSVRRRIALRGAVARRATVAREVYPVAAPGSLNAAANSPAVAQRSAGTCTDLMTVDQLQHARRRE